MDRLCTPEASVAEKFDRVREAGFDGMAIDLGALTMEQAEATVPHFARTGLAGGLTAFPDSVEALRPALLLAHRIAINPMPNGIPLTAGIVPYMIGTIMAVGLALLVTIVSFAISDERSARAGSQHLDRLYQRSRSELRHDERRAGIK